MTLIFDQLRFCPAANKKSNISNDCHPFTWTNTIARVKTHFYFVTNPTLLAIVTLLNTAFEFFHVDDHVDEKLSTLKRIYQICVK